MDASNPKMTDEMRMKNFRLTLDHYAKEWYDKADGKADYKQLKVYFSRYFSTQGKSIRNLHTRWNSFSFDPNTDDIEVFLRNVQETAKQLEYREATVDNMIKSKMSLAMHSTLYDCMTSMNFTRLSLGAETYMPNLMKPQLKPQLLLQEVPQHPPHSLLSKMMPFSLWRMGM